MKTIIFRTASIYLLPLLLLFSIFILLRGHYLPGGGFVGGLMASIAFVIHSFANGIEKTKKMENAVPVIGKVGSALFFDTGVYLVVIGVTLTIIFTISEGL